MKTPRKTAGVALTAMLTAILTALAFTGSAAAKLTGEFTKFQFCPVTNPEVSRCLHSLNTGGSVTLGSKKVPIVNPVTLQGGYSTPEEGPSKFFAATNGVTLSKAPQPVPGGLAGLINCNEISNFLLRVSCQVTFENGLTGVNSTLELARPASEIVISDSALAEGVGVAMKLPVRVRLENPFLGNNCYVGSSTTPIIWELTSGKTSPPPPNTPIEGAPGEVEFLEEGRVLGLNGSKLVDNAWSAPAAKGCGGLFSFLIDPIVNSSSGLPSAAGKNTAILLNTVRLTTPAAVIANDEENP